MKEAKNIAVSRGHIKINEDDIIAAYKAYSTWVFKSLLVENGITVKQISDFLYELLGVNKIIERSEIVTKMRLSKIDVSSDVEVDKFIDHLVSLTILGREIKSNVFEFEFDIDSDTKFKKMANRLGNKRFKIHNALHPFLECH